MVIDVHVLFVQFERDLEGDHLVYTNATCPLACLYRRMIPTRNIGCFDRLIP